jgi:hypothetical protein
VDNPVNGWNEWSRHVLAELTRLNTQIETLHQDYQELSRKMAVLQTEFRLKAGFWGAIGAAIPVVVLIAFKVLRL